MREMRRCLTLISTLALSAACAEKSPTGPVDASLASVSEPAASSPGRASAPRIVGARSPIESGLIGSWGGIGVRLTVGAGSSILQFDCANGTIEQPFAVDAAGLFDLAGTFVLESPGPIREDEKLVRHPARYRGSTDGKTLTFTITLTDSGQIFGPFTLALNAPGRVFKCL